jgi:geranylgeranyl diphosphate synthase type II
VDPARYLATRAHLVERALDARLPADRTRLRQAIRYSLLAGGKRIRPILALAAGEVAGTAPATLLPFACALEMIHTYSLVHDDLPAMDDDDLRRGRPTSHKVYGEGLAILVGDALLTEAFAVMASARGVPAARALRAVAEVAAAAGEAGMVGGQALDLAAEGVHASLARVRDIHRRKTGALLRVAVRVGGIVGGASPALLRRLTSYGEHLGLTFQIADDILDARHEPSADGRTDEALGKATYPGVLGMAGAERAAARERDAALAALAPLGTRAAPLRDIARYVVARLDPRGQRGSPSGGAGGGSAVDLRGGRGARTTLRRPARRPPSGRRQAHPRPRPQ